jgi:hypothetical protein
MGARYLQQTLSPLAGFELQAAQSRHLHISDEARCVADLQSAAMEDW